MTQIRKPLTNITWATFGSQYFTHAVYMSVGNGMFGWPVLSDLAHEMHAANPQFDFDTCQILVDGVVNQLPVVIRLKSGAREVGVIREMGHPQSWTSAHAALRQWGFTGRYYFSDIEKVEIPG